MKQDTAGPGRSPVGSEEERRACVLARAAHVQESLALLYASEGRCEEAIGHSQGVVPSGEQGVAGAGFTEGSWRIRPAGAA